MPQTRSGGRLGVINHLRLADLREALGVGPEVTVLAEPEYRAALASRRLLPTSDLIRAEAGFVRDGANMAYRYSQAWGLVYFLSRKHREAFAAYLKRVSARIPGQAVGEQQEIDEFEAAFGPLDDAFQRDWLSGMLELRFDPQKAGG